MGDHDHRLAQIIHAVAQDGQDLLGGVGIQVARGLIGEDHRRSAHQGPGAGHALNLAPRQLGGPVGQAVLEPDRLDDLLETLLVHLGMGNVQRQGDVLRRTQGGDQVEGLEDEADALPAQPGQAPLAHSRDLLTIEHDAPTGDRVQTRQAVHERGLARPRGPHDRGEPRPGNIHINRIQGPDRPRPTPIDLRQRPRRQHRIGHRTMRSQQTRKRELRRHHSSPRGRRPLKDGGGSGWRINGRAVDGRSDGGAGGAWPARPESLGPPAGDDPDTRRAGLSAGGADDVTMMSRLCPAGLPTCGGTDPEPGRQGGPREEGHSRGLGEEGQR